MARVTLGGVISSISGSVGSACFRNSPSGTVLYNRPLCSQRGTPAQHLNRNILKAAATTWGRLDDDIRSAWGSLAKQEHIPTFFSRGRRWTGRQLFTCFYFYAEHQYTPLPARWLPTPPLFNPSLSLSSYFFYPEANWPWVEPWQCTRFAARRPLVLNPSVDGDWSADCVFSCWAALLPPLSSRVPRSFSKIAPAPRHLPVTIYGGGDRPSGYYYSLWDTVFLSVFGDPPGLPLNTPTTVVSQFSTCIYAVCVSDSNISYSGLRWGHPHPSSPSFNYVVRWPLSDPPYVGISVWPGNIPTTEV